MKIFSLKKSVAYAAVAAIAFSGCSYKTYQAPISANTGTIKTVVDDSKLKAAQAELDAQAQKIRELEKKLMASNSKKSVVVKDSKNEVCNNLYPPNAKPGECYARVLIPAQYKTTTVKKIKKAGGEKIEIIPAKYGYETKKVLVKEPSTKLITIPATYEYVTEKILVKEASEKLVKVPAVYEEVEEKILIAPGYTTWKKGNGPIEKVDALTGEIMCLVEVPPKYKIIKKRVMKKPPTTKVVKIPAVYKTIKKKVVKTKARTKTVEIPAVYKTIKIKKVIQPATTKKITIPPTYQMVTQKVKIKDAELRWRPILCKTNINPGIVKELQRALKKANFNPGPIDGVYGVLTKAAVSRYQKAKGLPQGALTIETLRSLGIK